MTSSPIHSSPLSRLRAALADHDWLAFSLLTYGFAWMLGTLMMVAGLSADDGMFYLVAMLYMWGPALAALILENTRHRGRARTRLGMTFRMNRWMLVSMLVPVLLASLTVAASVWLGGMDYVSLNAQLAGDAAAASETAPMELTPGFLAAGAILFVVVSSVLNGLLALGEEIGWRGYLWSALREHGLWRASVATGILWGAWHWPLIYMGMNYGEQYAIGYVLIILACIPLSVIMSYLREKSGTTWSSGLFHGSLNSVAPITVVAVGQPDTPFNGILGLWGIFAMSTFVIAAVTIAKFAQRS